MLVACPAGVLPTGRAAEEPSMPDAVHSPRVVGELRPDFHSLETILATPPFAGKTGEAMALAIYDYFTSKVDGVWHFWPMDELDGNPIGWSRVEDPVKLLNCYGWTICGQNAAMLQGFYRAAGMPSRMRGAPGHTLCEVFFDGRWHILDVDMWTWFRTPAGHLASMEELAADPRALILDNTQRSNPCNLPDRTLEGYAQMYEEEGKKPVKTIFPFWAARVHTMDFVLRPGETLIRSQGDANRFNIPSAWKELVQGQFRSEWRERRPRERYEPLRTFGNGRWLYQPDLTAKTRDVELGAWSREGVTQDQDGLVGPGVIVFRIQSPYPFAGIADLDQPGFPAKDGVQLTLAGTGTVRAEITDAEGRFIEVAATRDAFTIKQDITQPMVSRYSALIRLTLADQARLSSFAFDGWIMTAPLSLPRLVEGANRMELRTLDKHGLGTVPWNQPVDFRSEAALRTALVRVEAGALAPAARNRVKILPPADGAMRAVFRFDAPAARRFAWAYAVATVQEGPVDAPAKKATLEWSADGAAWKDVATIAIPNTPLQWDASLDGEVRPPEAAGQLWLRVSSDTALTALDFAGHLAEAASPATLRIVHRWREAAGEREFAVPAGNAPYAVTCGADPRGHSIEMRVPSLPR